MTAAKQSAVSSAEFRAEAVRLARTSGKPYTQIARDLGMTTETLRKWLKQADLDAGKRHDGLTSDEQEGFLYLAVILDVFSRRVVGWSMQDQLRTDLVLAALEMAVSKRRPEAGLIHHADHG